MFSVWQNENRRKLEIGDLRRMFLCSALAKSECVELCQGPRLKPKPAVSVPVLLLLLLPVPSSLPTVGFLPPRSAQSFLCRHFSLSGCSVAFMSPSLIALRGILEIALDSLVAHGTVGRRSGGCGQCPVAMPSPAVLWTTGSLQQ